MAQKEITFKVIKRQEWSVRMQSISTALECHETVSLSLGALNLEAHMT
jgi:hypothetical protein